jgi:hypothetical protein
MRVLGVTREGDVVRAVLAERSGHEVGILAYYERPIDGDGMAVTALGDMIRESGCARVAMALPAEDVMFSRLPGYAALKRSEWLGQARILVEEAGLGDARVHLRVSASGVPYVAAARSSVVSSLRAGVEAAHGKLVFLDHESYAWSSVMPATAQALVVVRPEFVDLIICGSESVATMALGIEPAERVIDEGRVARSIAAALVEASKGEFADVDELALFDESDRFSVALRKTVSASTRIESYAWRPDGDDEDDRTAWALSTGIALRALGGDTRRVSFNFVERQSYLWNLAGRASRYVGIGDLAPVAAGALLALGLIGWRYTTVSTLASRAAELEAQVATAKQTAATVDQSLVDVTIARGILVMVETAQRSGPLAARDVASVVVGMGPHATATTLEVQDKGWTLSGHAPSYNELAGVLDTFGKSGFVPSLSSSQSQGTRVAYSLSFGEADASATPSPSPVVPR